MMIDTCMDLLRTYGPKIIGALCLFLGYWVAGVVFNRIARRVGSSKHINNNISHLIGRTGKVALIILGVVSALGTIGADVSALVASLGLTGFALGFALKDVLSNVLAGVLILTYKPFTDNDRIKVAGFEGTVTSVDLRYTSLVVNEQAVLIPNSSIFTNAITIYKPDDHKQNTDVSSSS